MMYDTIIIGAGAAGLFCAAHMTDKNKRVMILEGSNRPGLKLLVSGAGQCNFTHGGSMDDYLDKYGKNGRKIRKVLNSYTNLDVIDFFEGEGLKTWEREDGKVFPKSKNAKDLLEVLLDKIEKNNIDLRKNTKVFGLEFDCENKVWIVEVECKIQGNQKEFSEIFRARNVVVATGGITYPKTGSDGSMFEILKSLDDIKITEPMPALAPIFVEGYPFTEISGISIKKCFIEKVEHGVKKKDKTEGYCDDILFTHKNLSGPLILNYSRYLKNGDKIKIDFLPTGFSGGEHLPYKGCKKNLLNLLLDETGLPKGFLEKLSLEAFKIWMTNQGEPGQGKSNQGEPGQGKPNQGEPGQGKLEGWSYEKFLSCKSASLPFGYVKIIENLTRGWEFTVSGKGGLDVAMVTAGGVDMSQVSPSTMESKKHSGLHFVGEILNVDGNTGGYNIQFAFSSSYIAAQHILQLP